MVSPIDQAMVVSFERPDLVSKKAHQGTRKVLGGLGLRGTGENPAKSVSVLAEGRSGLQILGLTPELVRHPRLDLASGQLPAGIVQKRLGRPRDGKSFTPDKAQKSLEPWQVHGQPEVG